MKTLINNSQEIANNYSTEELVILIENCKMLTRVTSLNIIRIGLAQAKNITALELLSDAIKYIEEDLYLTVFANVPNNYIITTTGTYNNTEELLN